MKKYYLYILFIIVIVFTFVFFTSNSHLKSPAIQKPCEGSTVYNNYTVSCMESDNRTLNTERELVVNSNKEMCLLKDIIHPDSMYLILRYPMIYCGDCVNEILVSLQELTDSIPCIKVIVIVFGATIREMKVRMRPYEGKIPVYYSLVHDIGLPIDYSNIPYVIFVDDGKTSKHTLLVGSGYSELIRNYVQMLSRKYCKYKDKVYFFNN